ncbi:MAG: hypothetical protein ACM31C_22240 [Acidobacteriota bacterium]
MLALRRAWLVATACVAVIGAASAVVMRVELLDPGITLSPDTYGRALALHGLAMVGALVAAFVAIPTLVGRPGRGAVVLGWAAFAMWAAVMAVFMTAAFAPYDWMTGSPLGPHVLRAALVTLALGVAAGAAQLAASLAANAGVEARRAAVAAIGAIVALAIVDVPLVTGELPQTVLLVAASTVAVCSAIPAVLGSAAAAIVWLALAPCLAAAWIAYAIVHAVHASYLPDTVAMLAPFPALGGAVLAALFAAASRERVPPRIATAMFAIGTIATSAAFLGLRLRGMPRRYQGYLDEFQPLHVIAGVAAAVTVAGAIAAVRSRRR